MGKTSNGETTASVWLNRHDVSAELPSKYV